MSLPAFQHTVEIEFRIVGNRDAVVAAALTQHTDAHHCAAAVDVRGNAHTFAHTASETGIKRIKKRARFGVKILRSVERALVRTGKIHPRLIGVVHERGKLRVDAVVRVEVYDHIVRLFAFEGDELLHAVFERIERHAVRGIRVVKHKHFRPRRAGKFRSVVRTVMSDNIHVVQLLRIVLPFQNVPHGIGNHAALVVRGNEIGDTPLLVALGKALFGDKRKKNVYQLQ